MTIDIQHFTHLATPVEAFVWSGADEELPDPALTVQYVADSAWIGGTGKRRVLRIRGRGSYSFAQPGDVLCHYPDGTWLSMPEEAFRELYALTP